MKKYISRPILPIRCQAIQILEENKSEIEAILKDVHFGFTYEPKDMYSNLKQDREHTCLACWVYINKCNVLLRNGDYLIVMEDGRITARQKEVFEEEFQLI